MQQGDDDTRLRNTGEAAQWLGISVRMLFSITAPRGPLAAVRIGTSVKFDPADLRAYVEAAKQRPTAEAKPQPTAPTRRSA